MGDEYLYLYRAQVTGLKTASGEVVVGLLMGGVPYEVPRPLPLGGASWGLHWMPQDGDWVLVGFEPGMNPVIVAPCLSPDDAAPLHLPGGALAAGEIRLVPGPAGLKLGASASALIGLFGAAPVAQQTGGAATAGATYTATEQGMVNRMYAALRALGLLS